MFDISFHAFTLLLIRNPHNWHWHRVQFQSFTPLERALEHRASVHILPERAEKEKKRSQPPLEGSALPECWNGCAAVTGPVLLNSRSQISWCSLSELSNKRCDLIRVLGGQWEKASNTPRRRTLSWSHRPHTKWGLLFEAGDQAS